MPALALTSCVVQGSVEERRMRDKLTGELRRLERQKSELLTAFKKQQRLIDVLKRQKIHISTGRARAYRTCPPRCCHASLTVDLTWKQRGCLRSRRRSFRVCWRRG